MPSRRIGRLFWRLRRTPNVPPLPPHITSEQVKAFLAAFMKGDRPLAGVMAKSLKRAIHERV